MRKRPIVITVAVVAAAGALIAADRVGVLVAQHDLAGAVEKAYHLQRRPGITVSGVPFITQAVGGRYDRVEVNIGRWVEQPQNVEVDDLKITLHGVPESFGDLLFHNVSGVGAASTTASATISFASVKRHVTWDVSRLSAEGKQLRLVGSLNGPLGVTSLSVLASVRYVAGQGIAISPTSITATNDSNGMSTAELTQRLGFVVPLQALPGGAVPDRAEVTAQGLQITATTSPDTI
jgi:hypothetical protein